MLLLFSKTKVTEVTSFTAISKHLSNMAKHGTITSVYYGLQIRDSAHCDNSRSILVLVLGLRKKAGVSFLHVLQYVFKTHILYSM